MKNPKGRRLAELVGDEGEIKMQIGFPGLLTIIFVIAKLLGRITWSWWWVLCPVWIGFLLAVFFFVGCVFLGTLGSPRR